MTTPCVVDAIGRHHADFFIHGDLPQQVWQNCAVAISAGCKLHRPDVGGGGIHRWMDLALLAASLKTVLAGLPFTDTEEFYPGAVQEQVKRPIGALIRDLNGQLLLPSAKRRVIRHLLIQPRHFEQAGHYPGRLAERQLEQHLDRQAKLDCRI